MKKRSDEFPSLENQAYTIMLDSLKYIYFNNIDVKSLDLSLVILPALINGGLPYLQLLIYILNSQYQFNLPIYCRLLEVIIENYLYPHFFYLLDVVPNHEDLTSVHKSVRLILTQPNSIAFISKISSRTLHRLPDWFFSDCTISDVCALIHEAGQYGNFKFIRHIANHCILGVSTDSTVQYHILKAVILSGSVTSLKYFLDTGFDLRAFLSVSHSIDKSNRDIFLGLLQSGLIQMARFIVSINLVDRVLASYDQSLIPYIVRYGTFNLLLEAASKGLLVESHDLLKLNVLSYCFFKPSIKKLEFCIQNIAVLSETMITQSTNVDCFQDGIPNHPLVTGLLMITNLLRIKHTVFLKHKYCRIIKMMQILIDHGLTFQHCPKILSTILFSTNCLIPFKLIVFIIVNGFPLMIPVPRTIASISVGKVATSNQTLMVQMPLYFLLFSKHSDPTLLNFLRERGIDDNLLPSNEMTLLMYSISVHVCLPLLYQQVNERCELNQKDSSGNTAAHYATFFRNQDAVHLLSKFDANFFVRNRERKQPFQLFRGGMTFFLQNLKFRLISQKHASLHYRPQEIFQTIESLPAPLLWRGFSETLRTLCQNLFHGSLRVECPWTDEKSRSLWQILQIFPADHQRWDLSTLIQFIFLLPQNTLVNGKMRCLNNEIHATACLNGANVLYYQVAFGKTTSITVQLLRDGYTLLKGETSHKKQSVLTGSKRQPLQLPKDQDQFQVKISLPITMNHRRIVNVLSPLSSSQLANIHFFKLLKKCNNYFNREQIKLKPIDFTGLISILSEDQPLYFNTFKRMLEDLNGFFAFWVNTKTNDHRFPLYDIQPRFGRVTAFVWVADEAKQILESDSISCVILDATFSVVPEFVLSLVSVIILNSYVPLGFSLGQSENEELYERFYQAIDTAFNINLARFPVLSDRHKGIKSFCTNRSIVQFFCIIHILRNIGSAGHLVYAFKRLLKIEDSSELRDFLKYLSVSLKSEFNSPYFQNSIKSIGLKLENEELEIDLESNIFQQCCALYRVDLGVPMDTNSLESAHGHLNDSTPRNNIFIHSIQRIVSSIHARYRNLQKSIMKNFSNALQKLSKGRGTDIDNLRENTNDTETTDAQFCNCGETRRISNLYKISIPCRHLVKLGARYPQPTDLNIPIFQNPEPTKTIVVHHTHADDIDDDDDSDDSNNDDPGAQSISEKEKERKNCCDLTKLFEHILDLTCRYTKRKDRNAVGILIAKIFYNPPIYGDIDFPLKDKAARHAITHLCILAAEKDQKAS
jgi:hypothetical protein